MLAICTITLTSACRQLLLCVALFAALGGALGGARQLQGPVDGVIGGIKALHADSSRLNLVQGTGAGKFVWLLCLV